MRTRGGYRRVPFSDARVPVEMPKLVMTDLWRQSRIDPAHWEELLWCQEWADECFELGAYPDDFLMPDRDVNFLAKHMPPTFASAFLRRHLIKRAALRLHYQRSGRAVS